MKQTVEVFSLYMHMNAGWIFIVEVQFAWDRSIRNSNKSSSE